MFVDTPFSRPRSQVPPSFLSLAESLGTRLPFSYIAVFTLSNHMNVKIKTKGGLVTYVCVTSNKNTKFSWCHFSLVGQQFSISSTNQNKASSRVMFKCGLSCTEGRGSHIMTYTSVLLTPPPLVVGTDDWISESDLKL